jgi:hypothetical protein
MECQSECVDERRVSLMNAVYVTMAWIQHFRV